MCFKKELSTKKKKLIYEVLKITNWKSINLLSVLISQEQNNISLHLDGINKKIVCDCCESKYCPVLFKHKNIKNDLNLAHEDIKTINKRVSRHCRLKFRRKMVMQIAIDVKIPPDINQQNENSHSTKQNRTNGYKSI